MKRVLILGSTGSIGKQTLDVISNLPEFTVVGLGCNSNIALLREQKSIFKPKLCACIKAKEEGILGGNNAYTHLAEELDYDIIVACASSVSSLHAVVTAIKKGKRVALANKELLILAGDLLVKLAKQYNAQIIPVDSEHSAVFQCIGSSAKAVKSITLTCSGGALRDYTTEQLSRVTANQVLAHPNWLMGKKITVDCATLVNKAFEVIEATKLFQIPYSKVDVLLHRQSIVHGFVTFDDGSVIAQMAAPDMRLPIKYALTYPQRISTDAQLFSLCGKQLSFEQIDYNRFPLFGTVVSAAQKGDSCAAFIAGADEEAVNMFLGGAIDYPCLHSIITEAACKAPICGIDLQNAVDVYNEGEIFVRNSVGKK